MFTAAAVNINGDVAVVPLGNRRDEIPSLLFMSATGDVLIGEAADRRGATEPARLAREFKRRVGDPVPLLVGGSPYSAHALMARLLREVHAIVCRRHEAAPTTVTVTHPANWGPYKRELFGQAVRLAELGNVTLRPEPEAAAIQYAAGERMNPDQVVAVYDLGGGTFDAAVLRKTITGFALLGQPEGIEHLGGTDFDEAVFRHVIATVGIEFDRIDPHDSMANEAVARLRRDCVEAKEALSFDTEVVIPVVLPGLYSRVRLNRSEFEAMVAPALADTVAAMHRALRSAALAPTDIKCILLAGGSSRIPLVSQLLTTTFERPVALDPRPEHSVALGAALNAAPARSIRGIARVVTPYADSPTASPTTGASGPTADAAASREQPGDHSDDPAGRTGSGGPLLEQTKIDHGVDGEQSTAIQEPGEDASADESPEPSQDSRTMARGAPKWRIVALIASVAVVVLGLYLIALGLGYPR